MFNVSKKTLSVVLCLALLLSVVAVCFMTSATAKTVTSTELMNPVISYTFDGEAPYGLPYGRYNSAAYNDGYATLISKNGWVFLGTEASKTSEVQEEYDYNNKGANSDYVAENLFPFEAGKSYIVTVDYYFLAGSEISDRTIQMKLAADPDTGGVADSLLTTNKLTGNTVEWKVNGVAETGATLTANSDKQTLTATVTVGDAGGYYGICNYHKAKVDDVEVEYNATMAIDSIKVYDTETYKSVIVESDVIYHDMENDNVGTTIGTNNTSNITIVDSGEEKYGKVLQTAASGNYRFSSMEGTIFERGKKYYISFDAKSTSGSGTISWITLGDYAGNGTRVGIATTPALNSGSTPLINCWYVDGVNVGTWSNFKVEENVWHHYGFVLDLTDDTVADAIKAQASGIFDAARNITFGRPGTWFDNFRIVCTQGVDGAVPDTNNDIIYGVSNKYTNDFTGMTTDDILVTDATQIAFEDAADGTEHGTVAKMSSTAKVRFSPKDSQIMTSGNKYTISFDAKLSEGESSYIWMGVANGESGGGKPRYIFNDTTGTSSNNKGKQAFKLYIDGVETAYSDFKMDTTWRTYTIAFDFADEEFLTEFSSLVDVSCNFHIGCANGWFDNFEIVERSLGGSEVSYREAQVKEDTYYSAGLRFKATIPTATVDAAEEIGFVAAPSTHASVTTDWYKLEEGLNSIALQGVAKNDTKNLVYATYGTLTDYQMVITGLSAKVGTDLEGKTAFNRRFSVVLYTKIDGAYSYYALGEASYYQILGISETLKAQ